MNLLAIFYMVYNILIELKINGIVYLITPIRYINNTVKKTRNFLSQIKHKLNLLLSLYIYEHLGYAKLCAYF